MNVMPDDFANYVKEKTGIEPEIRKSPESGKSCVYFGSEFKEAYEHSPSRVAQKLNAIAAKGLTDGIKDGSKAKVKEDKND